MSEDLPELPDGQDWLRIVIPVDILKSNESRVRESAGEAAVAALRDRRQR